VRRRFHILLLVPVFFALASGCVFGEKPKPLTGPEADLFRAKGDDLLRKEAESGRTDPFAAIAVFRNDAFLHQSGTLADSSFSILNEMGNAVILMLRPAEVAPFLKDPSVRKVSWFGPQERLTRLEPSFELDLLARFGAGTEDRDVDILLRLVDAGGAAEERHVAESGFRLVTRAGPTWVLSGPMAGIPKLLANDRIVYVEGATNTRIMPR
jgi:hypothetical protein